MKLCRFNDNRLGVVDGREVIDVTEALDVIPRSGYPLPAFDPLIANLEAVTQRIGALRGQAERLVLEDVRLLSPVANPGKVVAAPVNYRKHLEEVLANADLHHDVKINHIEKAGLFLKAPSSLVGAGQGIQLRKLDRRNDHEVELAVVIGRTADRVSRAQALQHVAGYCIGLDITIRGPEERSFRKSPDTYTVLGPWLTAADEVPYPVRLDLQISVNGERRQKSNTTDLILGVAELIEFASSFYTLQPGDVILTGTPEGVSPIRPGDVILAEISDLGSMTVHVSAKDEA
ncbi:MAG: fumarylacetoacetate hydrolase family protein, partial [Mesorhizobium sp.]|nr:fumarylacetoacetate hydrolase family protein [Mesorhizobium sp.]